MGQVTGSMAAYGEGNGSLRTREGFVGPPPWSTFRYLEGTRAFAIPEGRPLLTFTGCLVPAFPLPTTLKLEEPEKRVLALQVDRGVNLSWTSSCGRLFDVVAALGGGCLNASYEAQGAIEMEMLCRDIAESYPYDLRLTGESLSWGETGCLPACSSFREVALTPLLKSVLQDVREGRSLREIGSKFHRSVARMAGEVSSRIAEETGLTGVVLSGGCFQNRLLLELTVEELRSIICALCCTVRSRPTMEASPSGRRPLVILH